MAVIPPVAGGETYAVLTDQEINIAQVINSVKSPSRGGIVNFIGLVREVSQGRDVLALHYEAYEEMVKKQLHQIIETFRAESENIEIGIVHRFGKLEVGDVALVIAVGAPHRKEAFETCRAVLEEIKKDLPIWKKEMYVDGEEWVGWGGG